MTGTLAAQTSRCHLHHPRLPLRRWFGHAAGTLVRYSSNEGRPMGIRKAPCRSTPQPLKGLLVQREWVEKILRGQKSWELRRSRTAARGAIALIQIGTGTVVGTCEIVDVVGPLSLAELRRTTSKHRVPPPITSKPYTKTYAWVVRRARRLSRPVPYRPRRGQQIWVRLSPKVIATIARAARQRS